MAHVETYTHTEEEIIEMMIGVVEATTLPDEGPALKYSRDEMVTDGDLRTLKDGSFVIETSSAASGGASGNWGYVEQRLTARLTAYRRVRGTRRPQSRREMVALQAAIRDALTQAPVFAALTLWRLTDLPRPVKDGDDWYRVEVGAEALYYTSAQGRA